jgi:hypothetical protein|tara:strand:+ start:730 stop:1059 length:330 start_codon:yes stop_codon:yes gene_type:complete
MARAMSLKGKVATFKQLQNIIKKGRENEYNRQLDETKLKPFLIKELEKMHMDINEVKFPMTALMIHEHAQGEKVAPHIRASIYIPGTGQERTIIDVDWNSWEKLDIVEA